MIAILITKFQQTSNKFQCDKKNPLFCLLTLMEEHIKYIKRQIFYHKIRNISPLYK